MNAWETGLASTLLPCPHCGKAPSVDMVSKDDDSANWLDVSFIRQIRLGRPYYRIECCTVLEGNEDWDAMRKTWNRRTPARETLQEGMERAPGQTGGEKAVDALNPKRPTFHPRYDDVYYDGLSWLR